jgi:N-acetylmuramoyl-L-alanine amidase CwlA
MAILKPDNTLTMGGIKINYYPINRHNTRGISMPTAKMSRVIGVTVHNTDWISVASGTTPAEQYTRATVNGNMTSVRVHYYVDDVCAWQNLPLTLTSWHAADGNGNGNMHTISIECIMSKAYNQRDRQSEDNAARLAAALLKTYGLTIDNLYTHTHWLNVRDGKTGSVDYLNTAKHPYKMCPAYILPHWAAFKAAVAKYMGQEQPKPEEPKEEDKPKVKPDGSFLVKVICSELNVRSSAGTQYPVRMTVRRNEIYTIVMTMKSSDGGTWGKLKSGAGWINIGRKYVKRV